MVESLLQAVLAHFSSQIEECLADPPPDCHCEMAEIVTHGKARGAGDELCVWLAGVETIERGVRRYSIGIQCLRTGYPKAGDYGNPDEDSKIPAEDIEAVTPFFNSIGEGMLAAARDFESVFGARATIRRLVPQGPTGGQAGYSMLIDCMNPRVP